ncbi:MAG TPA: 5'/3'-nucleotidase SurE [Candidatus Omnitrophota bacterium]|nr:5'/3'-nucleotidase SurE [Candidatus Omnitrophota bacterium]HPN55758.1 5'/3'-nucleotidase SurE [Candidatus Omnitrophota bacterium]
MTILITNDDGVYSEGIYALVAEMKRMGEIVVVAPDSERSSVGHGITLSHPIWYKEIRRKGAFFGYGISGTPADCVKFAIKVILKKKPGLVVSGINIGGNDGSSVFYSGTVAGAREGALSGIPSLAVSLDTFVNPDFRTAAKVARLVARDVLKRGLPKGTFLNINVPNLPAKDIKGIRAARQCVAPIEGIFKKRQDPSGRTYYWMSGKAPRTDGVLDVDTSALKKKYITISPVQCDLTDYQVLENLQQWNLERIPENL